MMFEHVCKTGFVVEHPVILAIDFSRVIASIDPLFSDIVHRSPSDGFGIFKLSWLLRGLSLFPPW